MESSAIQLDAIIFGGGVTGLWLLDELRRSGRRALLIEANSLGAGQTVASQGIIHGGLKYTLDGLFNPSAAAIAEMPLIWRACLANQRQPHLRGTRIRAEFCHLWRTGSLASRVGMLGAKVGLRVKPQKLPHEQWPAALQDLEGEVLRLDEVVIDPVTLLAMLAAANADSLIHALATSVQFERRGGDQAPVKLNMDRFSLTFDPRVIVFAAGEGNGRLREKLGLSTSAMQLRPLHMAMARGKLPELNGHCTDGAKTRVTITTDRDSTGRTIWQIGGQVAEDGVELSRAELLRHAQREIAATVPWFAANARGVEWSTYRVARAEAATGSGKRPEDVAIVREANVITCWPTKLALAPRLAEKICEILPPPGGFPPPNLPPDVPRPRVAAPPWELEAEWNCAD